MFLDKLTSRCQFSSAEKTSTARLEYRSCVGPAAVSINLAQPFIDDVKLEIDPSPKPMAVQVQVKSSSRMGSSDFFVNKKRVEYLGNGLRQRGWVIPEVKYGK